MFARMKSTHESKTKHSFAFFYWFDSLNTQLLKEMIYAADFVTGKTVLRMLMALWKSPFQCIHQNVPALKMRKLKPSGIYQSWFVPSS